MQVIQIFFYNLLSCFWFEKLWITLPPWDTEVHPIIHRKQNIFYGIIKDISFIIRKGNPFIS